MSNNKLDEEFLVGSGGLETPTFKLPRDVFRSKFTCFVATHKTSFFVIGGEFVFTMNLILWGIKTSTASLSISGFLLLFLGLPITIIVVAIRIDESKNGVITLTDQMHFLNQIIQQRPGIPMDKWDVIAANMNQILYTNGSYPNPYYFFDGKACFSKFKALFLKSYSGEETQSSSTPYDERKPYIARAVKIYQESVDTFWAQQVEGSSMGV